MNTLYYYANPYDIKCKQVMDTLFDNKIYPLVIQRTSPDNDKGLWISYLPTVVLVDAAGREHARTEDITGCTVTAVQWMRDNADAIAGGTADKTKAPAEVKFS